MDTRYIEFEEMRDTLESILVSESVPAANAELCARVISESTFDGVFSHGIFSFIPLIESLRSRKVDACSTPAMAHASGAFEIWDGGYGIGIVQSTHCTERAIALAKVNGIGCVGLKNTSHWLRAGSYAWQAVRKGYALICWTNTISNMPGWGASVKSVGNNPIAIGVPHPESPIVLDMAMSQYALGSMKRYAENGEELPVPGGFDANGVMSRDAAAIMESGRVLPAGFWKGSGLAIALDALAAIITGGRATCDYDEMGVERGVSQVFLAFDAGHGIGSGAAESIVARITAAITDAPGLDPDAPPKYPGAGALERRNRHMKTGVPIESELWDRILRLAGERNGRIMRRSEKERNDPDWLERVLAAATVCRIAFLDAEDQTVYPYIVPLHFAHADRNIYLHSASEGRKIDIIRQNPKVGFEVDELNEIVTAQNACGWGSKYVSIIGHGDAEIVDETEEKRKALALLMEKYSNRAGWEFRAEAIEQTTIIRVKIREMTGKES